MAMWKHTAQMFAVRRDCLSCSMSCSVTHGKVLSYIRCGGDQRLYATATSRPHPTTPEKDYHKEDKYQFLTHSSLPTYYFQKSLPRLPVPKLDLTCQRYLESVQNLLSEEQFNLTQKVVNEFQTGSGKGLQEQLLDFDKSIKESSYICAMWFEMYLRDRQSLPINYNPALVFVEDETIDKLPQNRRQVIRATNLLVSSLRFMKSLDAESLGPEVYHMNPKKSDTQGYRNTMKMCPTAFATYASYLFKAFPLDMSQFNNLFRSTRIPGIGIDTIQLKERNINHIVVQRRGHFYKCRVLDSDGNILPVSELLGNLEYIMDDNCEPAKYPLGVMTTENRDAWAGVRDYILQKSPVNKSSIEDIDSALFSICLDDVKLGTDPVPVSHHFLHSDGRNRWFDKSFQLILSSDAWAGITFEHAWGDGVAVMRFFNEIYADSKAHQWSNNSEVKRPKSPPAKLGFEFDAKINQAIEEAIRKHKEKSEQLQISPFIFEKFGKKECKKWLISPDSVMQLGFQIAFYRMYGQTPPTYESCSTSAFKHGRTEAIRPATNFTKSVAQIMAGKEWTSRKAELKELVKKCSEKHNALTKDAAMGQGFDRHLFALRKIAEQNGKGLPQLYQDPAYAHVNYNQLSTSTLASPLVRLGGFGPVVEDGFGLGYQIWDGGLGCVTATYKGERDGPGFVDTCHKVFDDIKTIMST